MPDQGLWDQHLREHISLFVSYKNIHKSNDVETSAIEGESPVDNLDVLICWHPSNAGHVKSGMNLGGPPSKAQYSYVTDSEPVP